MTVPAVARSGAFSMGPDDGQPIYVLGNEVIIKVSSRDTGGAFTIFEGVTRPLGGPPLHLHRDQDECWHVLEGEYKFEVDGRKINAGPGATVFAPRGSRHTFQNIGATPGRLLTTVVPGGIDVFFEELETAMPQCAVPDPAKMVPIFDKHGQELLGPPLSAMLAAGL